jgi:hypothetical protein
VPINVTPDNFVRAESDLYFGNLVKDGGFGKFHHIRELSPVDNQLVIRQNRDTLYSAGVFDLDVGPVAVTLPEAGDRFMSLQIITEDHYVPVSQKAVRDALLALARTLPDTKRAFGTKQSTEPVRHLICSASAWGGNPETDALYLNVTPAHNDGTTVYRLNVGDVPVDGFWSVTVYNKDGYFTPNPQNAYSLNNITAAKGADGSVDVQFGGCDGSVANCLPITDGWNYLVRLYRPRPEVLDGSWTFPEAQSV